MPITGSPTVQRLNVPMSHCKARWSKADRLSMVALAREVQALQRRRVNGKGGTVRGSKATREVGGPEVRQEWIARRTAAMVNGWKE